jgi:hypothetical protein
MILRSIGFAGAGVLLASTAMGAAAADSVALNARGELVATYLGLDDRGDRVIQGGEASSYWTLGGGGWLDAAWRSLHLQLDFSGEGNLDERSANDTYLGSFGGGLHAGWRKPELGSLGLFGAVGNLKINDEDARNPETIAWGVGLEGQVFFDATTLYLQSGYLDRESVSSGGDIDALKNAGFVRGVGRYFWRDALELEAEASFAAGTMDPDQDDVVIVGWGAEVEYRLRDTPFAAFVGYTGAYYNQDDDDDELFEHRVGFGVRIYFGQASLRANDRQGASLDLPRYLEWNGQIAGALE